MKERIIKLMKSENLSPSQLADNLQVQRSGVSHIISGRNNPGLDFIQRILRYYPNINPDWLLLNKGPMYRNLDGTLQYDEVNSTDSIQSDQPAIIETETDVPLLFQQNDSNTVSNEKSNIPLIKGNKETDKILILYKDGSFDIYQ